MADSLITKSFYLPLAQAHTHLNTLYRRWVDPGSGLLHIHIPAAHRLETHRRSAACQPCFHWFSVCFLLKKSPNVSSEQKTNRKMTQIMNQIMKTAADQIQVKRETLEGF